MQSAHNKLLNFLLTQMVFVATEYYLEVDEAVNHINGVVHFSAIRKLSVPQYL